MERVSADERLCGRFLCETGILLSQHGVFGAIGVHQGWAEKVAIDSRLNREGRRNLCSGDRDRSNGPVATLQKLRPRKTEFPRTKRPKVP